MENPMVDRRLGLGTPRLRLRVDAHLTYKFIFIGFEGR